MTDNAMQDHDILLLAKLQKLNTELQEALENMLGAFDTPMSRCRENSEFANEAREQARELIKRIKGDTTHE